MKLSGVIVSWRSDLHILQGFRKVDPDKWEFANEGFLRGNRNLLKNIHRRKSPQSQQNTSCAGSSSEAPPGLGSEIERLQNDKRAMMEEVIELQQQQRGTSERMELVKDRLQASEQRQKQMVSFLAKVFHYPGFVDRLKHMKENRALDFPRSKKKFLKQSQPEAGSSSASVDRQVSMFRPDLPKLGDLASSGIPEPGTPDYLLQDVVTRATTGTETMPFQVEDVPLDKLAASHELLEALGPVDAVPSSAGARDPFSTSGQVSIPQPEANPEYLGSLPEELAKDRALPDFCSSGLESMIKQEEVWSMGFDLSTDIAVSSPALWSNIGNYDVGPSPSGDFSDALDLGSLPAASSRIETWPDEGSPLGYPGNQPFKTNDDDN